MRNKSFDLEQIASNLDITPSMYCYAVDRYKGIAQYLESKGIRAEFYPQGSFRTGTVTRPMKNGVESDFDIDVVCVLWYDKNVISPKMIKKIIGDALMENKIYRKKLQPEEDRCWTLAFADFSENVGLKLDVVPSVHEDNAKIMKLIGNDVDPRYAKQAISITDKRGSIYEWLSSNPSGFGDWFDNINSKYLAINLYQKKKKIFQDNRHLFEVNAKIEDVPDYYVRSDLQRVIQLLKRHRDLYFYRNGSNYRPSSVIITSLVARIASETLKTDLASLLDYVVDGLSDYSSLLRCHRPIERYAGEVRDYIQIKEKKWNIPNPVDPEDNYAESWTNNHAEAFFKWIDAVKRDLSKTSVMNESKYVTGLQTSFGQNSTRNILGLYDSKTNENLRPIEIKKPVKAWGK